MKLYEVFASEGGYRYAGAIWADGPVIDQSPWFETKDEAEEAAEKARARGERLYDEQLARAGLTRAEAEKWK